jgi:peptidoglycan-N-acetylglucosamine deacetylase
MNQPDSVRPAVALTFDDGPGPSTDALLDVLSAHGVKATFFLLGRNIEEWYGCAVRIAREGHVLGNHSFSHARPHDIDPEDFILEIERTDRLLKAVALDGGVSFDRPPLCRLPYGPVSGDVRLAALASIGRAHQHWTEQFEDWKDPDPAKLAVRMREHIELQHAVGRLAVLDLHDASRIGAKRDATVEAVRLLLQDHQLRVVTELA